MNETKHSPQWETNRFDESQTVILQDKPLGKMLMATVTGERHQERAELIVRAVNAHDKLVETLEAISRLGANPITEHGCESRADFVRHCDKMWRTANGALLALAEPLEST